MNARTKRPAVVDAVDAAAAAAALAAAKPVEAVDMGSGNVFTDLGLPDADDRRLRVQLATRLNDLLELEGVTQAAAAKRLGISQPHVSELKHYKLGRFSSERLLHFITLMGRDVEIFIRPRAASQPSDSLAGAVTVWAATGNISKALSVLDRLDSEDGHVSEH